MECLAVRRQCSDRDDGLAFREGHRDAPERGHVNDDGPTFRGENEALRVELGDDTLYAVDVASTRHQAGRRNPEACEKENGAHGVQGGNFNADGGIAASSSRACRVTLCVDLGGGR